MRFRLYVAVAAVLAAGGIAFMITRPAAPPPAAMPADAATVVYDAAEEAFRLPNADEAEALAPAAAPADVQASELPGGGYRLDGAAGETSDLVAVAGPDGAPRLRHQAAHEGQRQTTTSGGLR